MIFRTTYIVLIALLLGNAAKAQVTPDPTIVINVSATLISDTPIVMTTLNNMVVAGAPDEKQEIYVSPITSPNAGLLLAKGRPGSQARMTYIISEVLSEQEHMGSISMKYEMSGNAKRIQRTSQLIDTGEAVLNFDEDGLYYLWVGGHIDVSKAVSGKYNGQFTIQIEYI